ncbi:D-2-hydroxyacid dehydrogenase [Hymenobacter sp. BT175]|uniref:D-2-hydroxyacid dehydrogenase n=1 Tax=Hymenobacter translucens TaxID=2886507 RepID=UPI001D0DCA23|nr:D-2-hydroxyacid dehydrogenase [Hymenobacter translucens]MCC2547850.1 D-2-hydroxyacid dehydrogenase [Hymenobacter translucens]
MLLFVYTALSEPLRAYLRQHLPPGVEAVFRTELPESGQQAAFRRAELLLGNPPAHWFDEQLPALRFWQIDSSGFEPYCHLRPTFPVANMGDYFAWPCAETIVAGILALYRNIPELAVLQSRQQWVGQPVRATMRLMLGKQVIILGAGSIGLAVREQLGGFRCRVQLLARTNPAAQLHSREELLAALPSADLVINCLPGTAPGFFSRELIEAMPAGSVYASVGRGTTTDEPALIAALQSGHLGGAVLDVTAVEPLPADNPLWTMPNVLLTQHSAGGQPHEDDGKGEMLLRNLGHLLAGEPLENVVDLSRGY